ncbi:RNA polymerase sigma factor [Portibacter lacus]|uniref:DNA-directed RNA polymerase sigma-70 factor n=1 Tax=Portibacter lacus TaxID=1099794 RepID=A0AA37SR56_9BACT|nr:sigma-70 family RNA polymerase sigma factor [Portibacter lacus]GLR18382.1 DNA-directed RNA polymerase sigma-70 factor [Portibacter lacus]
MEKNIKLCKAGNRKAQKALYDFYSPILFGICRRYLKNTADAEDVFIHGMFKIFDNIHKYKGDGSFEGWMKRIMVNESLMHIRKHKKLNLTVEWSQVNDSQDPVILDQLAEEDIKDIIMELPEGYRTVFNLYVIEGYKHREIGEMLGISINTSKSQLILAKKKMREFIKKKDLDEKASYNERYK